MGSTNKTEYLKLPQWIGTDQPTWLGDMNDAFLKIDGGFNTISGEASTATSVAGNAVQTATNAKNTADAAKSAADTAQGAAETAQNTAEEAEQTANSVKTSVTNLTQRVQTVENDINKLANWTGGNMTAGGSITKNVFSVAYFNQLNFVNIVAKITGFAASISTNDILYTLPSSFANIVKSNRTLYGALNVRTSDGNFQTLDLSLKKSGSTVTLAFPTAISQPLSVGSINLMLNSSSW